MTKLSPFIGMACIAIGWLFGIPFVGLLSLVFFLYYFAQEARAVSDRTINAYKENDFENYTTYNEIVMTSPDFPEVFDGEVEEEAHDKEEQI